MKPDLKTLAERVEKEYEADILVYFGAIRRPWDDLLIDLCRERKKKKNVLLFLGSYGGDAHAAYRIARSLRQNYHKPDSDGVVMFVNSICASAGTLITLASDRLILSHHAELGPLDVQILKPDEVGERTSGLTPIQALRFLEAETGRFFTSQFRNLRFSRTFSFSTRLGADVAAQLASGLLAKLYEQIDPLRLAEYDRTNRIAEQYGERIKSENVKQNAITQLLEKYPSHEFCIDPVEAKELFHKVEEPSEDLEKLGNMLKPLADKNLSEDDTTVFYLTEQSIDNTHAHKDKPASSHENSPKPVEPNGDSNPVSGDGHNSKSSEMPSKAGSGQTLSTQESLYPRGGKRPPASI